MKLHTAAAIAALGVALSGCATIVDGSSQSVSVSTTPALITSISWPVIALLAPPNEISAVAFWLWSSYSASSRAPEISIDQFCTVCTAQLRGVSRRRCSPWLAG